ncbi:hypothetical protein APT98_15690 [Klebsiella quasipneumoniae]|nr:hypothetical protein APT98_15690 [Klebsiella quasipneumoniae]
MQQPCGSKIKQQTWTLIAEPGASIEQTLQSECPGEITKIMIIIMGFYAGTAEISGMSRDVMPRIILNNEEQSYSL